MLAYSIKRILQIIPVLIVISLLVFLMMHMIPGDPVKNMLGMEASEKRLLRLKESVSDSMILSPCSTLIL